MAITPLKKMFGGRVREYLAQSRIRQQDVARKLGISSSAVSQMLTGKIVPSMSQLDKICEMLALECSKSLELRDWLTRIRVGIDTLQSSFNESLGLYRKRRGLSIGQLSKLTGVSVSRLTLMESSCDSRPTSEELAVLSRVLDCETDNLMGGATYLSQPMPSDMMEIREMSAFYDAGNEQQLPLLSADELRYYWEQPDWISKICQNKRTVSLPSHERRSPFAIAVLHGDRIDLAPGLEAMLMLGLPEEMEEGGMVLRLLDGGKFELRILEQSGLTGCLKAMELVAKDARRVLPVFELTIRRVKNLES